MPDIKGIIVSGVVPKIPYGTTYADVEALIQYRAGQITLDGDIRSHGQLWCADVNSDFEITDTDVYILSGQTRPNTYYIVPTLLGDINCDGEVDTTDLLLFKDCLDYVETFLNDFPGSTTDDAYESLLTESGISITKQGLVNAFYADGDKAYGEYDKPWV